MYQLKLPRNTNKNKKFNCSDSYLIANDLFQNSTQYLNVKVQISNVKPNQQEKYKK